MRAVPAHGTPACCVSAPASPPFLSLRLRLGSQTTSSPASRSNLEELLKSELAHAKLWIEGHVSDHSAIDYAFRVSEALGALPPNPAPNPNPDPDSDNAQLRARYTKDCACHAL